jgi:hypothetical protein
MNLIDGKSTDKNPKILCIIRKEIKKSRKTNMKRCQLFREIRKDFLEETIVELGSVH